VQLSILVDQLVDQPTFFTFLYRNIAAGALPAMARPPEGPGPYEPTSTVASAQHPRRVQRSPWQLARLLRPGPDNSAARSHLARNRSSPAAIARRFRFSSCRRSALLHLLSSFVVCSHKRGSSFQRPSAMNFVGLRVRVTDCPSLLMR